MKKILLTTLFVLSLVSLFATEPATITGSWNRGRAKDVKLYRIVSGRLEELASYNMLNDNKFGFLFNPQGDGFYVVGSGLPVAATDKYTFYFKPGDQLNIAVNDSTYTLTGKNTPENIALTKWHDYTITLEWRSVYFFAPFGRYNKTGSTYVDYFPALEEYAGKLKTYQSATGNKPFDKQFEQFQYYDLLRYATTFIMTPRSAHPESEDYTEFYKSINLASLTSTTELLDYPLGANVLNNCVWIKNKWEDKKPTEESAVKLTYQEQQKIIDGSRQKMVSEINNDTLKGEFAIGFAGSLKTYDTYTEFEKQYGKYMLTEDQKTRMNAVLTKIAQVKPKAETIDFSGTDVNDKTVSLSSFKGKVVVVDVWATWCGPCKKEIPALKEVEKEYHGKDVVFLSISVDEAKDKQKWKDFVAKEELVGVQLFGGKGLASDVSQFYNIKAIPRFMVFGKDGKVVTDNGPRPSGPDLRPMLNSELKK